MTKLSRRFSAAVLVAVFGPALAWAGATDSLWMDQAARSLDAQAPQPAQYRLLALDDAQMLAHLRKGQTNGVAVDVSVPLPEGGFAEFTVVDSGVMPTGLQEKFPDILSFKGTDNEGRRVRLDVSPLGFQAMVFDPQGIWVVRPEVLAAKSGTYLSFRRADLESPAGMGQCDVHEHGEDDGPPIGIAEVPDYAPMTETGVQKRTYRAAVAANHQFIAAVGGGTAAGGMAATVTTMNRVNEVYEYEMAIHLQLVPNNDVLMFPNATTDPFAANGSSVINISTPEINSRIGAANYDIGHVFTTGSGGVAYLRSVCGSSHKAGGTTGLTNPTGDVFYIDYVSHEMGHQFGGNHPFNGSLGSCSGSNRSASTAYEPGSGSTIMAYAGICGADNLQNNSNPYFHAISLQEITDYTNAGGNCSANDPNYNQPPDIDLSSLPPAGLTIPSQTPFRLHAEASDPDVGDVVQYSWEQWDLGPQAPLTAGDNGSSPIFRSLPPKATGERIFPSMETVLGGPPVKGETLPTTSRQLTFRLTARDLREGNGTSQSIDYSLQVSHRAGPFTVTSPPVNANWTGGDVSEVIWNVAGTQSAPVLCHSVDIALSVDGGQSFSHALAVGVPNIGTAMVAVPQLASNEARIRVHCANNVFFNVSPGNFTIVPGDPGPEIFADGFESH